LGEQFFQKMPFFALGWYNERTGKRAEFELFENQHAEFSNSRPFFARFLTIEHQTKWLPQILSLLA
jgi:hypothetical protein